MFDAIEIKWFYGYKAWCKRNNVVYNEADDMSLSLHKELLSNPLYKATCNLYIDECNGRLLRKSYKYE